MKTTLNLNDEVLRRCKESAARDGITLTRFVEDALRAKLAPKPAAPFHLKLIERLVKGDTALTVDTALRLSAFFGNTPEFWMNLQRSYDIARARESVDVSEIVPLAAT